jgi:hypothetical protein
VTIVAIPVIFTAFICPDVLDEVPAFLARCGGNYGRQGEKNDETKASDSHGTSSLSSREAKVPP